MMKLGSLFAVVLAILIAPVLHDLLPPRTQPVRLVAAAPVAAVRWEYKLQVLPDDSFEAEMLTLGNAGWELVFARRASNGEFGAATVMSYECIFKRRRP